MKDLEIWKIYKLGFDSSGLLVSNLGRIKRFDWEDRSMSDNGSGYKKAAIHNISKEKKFKMKNLYIHRIVAELFLPTPLLHQTQVNHIDGDKGNNCVSNLEWVCPKENIQHMHKQGLNKGRIEHGTTVTLPDQTVANAYLSVKIGMYGVREAADKYGMPRTTLSSIMNKRSRRDVTDMIDNYFMFTKEKLK
ncbi:MAG: HNH endonuclease [Erysipelotrichaceae bacterium]